jgi:hypothetical protein
MSTNAIDINDLDRLSAESRLTENAPRALPEEPVEESNPGIELIKTLAAMILDRETT